MGQIDYTWTVILKTWLKIIFSCSLNPLASYQMSLKGTMYANIRLMEVETLVLAVGSVVLTDIILAQLSDIS